MKSTDWGRYLTRYAVLTYLGVVLMAPVAIILWLVSSRVTLSAVSTT